MECLVMVDLHSGPDDGLVKVEPHSGSGDGLVRVDSHSGPDVGVQGRVLSTITNDEAMEFAPVGTYPSTHIEVLIVGTGFGGLTAALEFTRKGHSVRIIERNNEPDVSGKSMTVGV
jgi:NADPH-dependent 2,4-dienoyl-CoA reductase/sulfur reductase-like enzyme